MENKMRTGVIAKKVGMTRFFNDTGEHVPVTILKLDDVQVVAVKKYSSKTSLQLGAGNAKIKNVSKAMKGHFSKASVLPKIKLAEFPITDDALVEIGVTFKASHFANGQKIDVVGKSHGKGFAGAMKRHNFSGLRASHGVSISHRSHGSTGQCQDPGKVFKGKKMAGHLGSKRVKTQNLTVINTDDDSNLIFVSGAVPGPKNGWIYVTDALKFPLPDKAPFPAGLVSDNEIQKIQKVETNNAPSSELIEKSNENTSKNIDSIEDKNIVAKDDVNQNQLKENQETAEDNNVTEETKVNELDKKDQ